MPQHATRKQVQGIDSCSELLLTVFLCYLSGRVLQDRGMGLNHYWKQWLQSACVVPSPRVPPQYERLDAAATFCCVQLDKQRILLLPRRTLCTRPWG
jgi:hypothetical protein